MRLSQSYQPLTLDEVVGQPAVIRRLKRLVAWPQPCCLLFRAWAAWQERSGQGPDSRFGRIGVRRPFALREPSCGSRKSSRLFNTTFRYRPMSRLPWNILLVEEMELLPSRNVVAELKDQLSEQNIPSG